MAKLKLSQSLLLAFLTVVFVSPCVSHASDETLTITTYYPSPYGVYNELHAAKRMAIGDVNGDGQYTPADMAVDNLDQPIAGSLSVARGIAIGDGQKLWPGEAMRVKGRVALSFESDAGGVALGNALALYNHATESGLYTNPLNPSEEAPILSGTGIDSRGAESPVSNIWTGYDFVSSASASGFIGARIAAQFPYLGSENTETCLLFINNTAAGLKESMRIDNHGNVGIGTTNPEYALHIVDNGNIFVVEGPTQRFYIGDYSNGCVNLAARRSTDGAVTNMHIYSTLGYETQLYLKYDGNIGIGTSNPQSTLQINGGYLQIPVGQAYPPAADCNEESELGRMKTSGGSGVDGCLWVCIKKANDAIEWRRWDL